MKAPPKPRGRPKLPPEQKLLHGTVRFTAGQWAKIDQNGMDWLRKLVDRARPK